MHESKDAKPRPLRMTKTTLNWTCVDASDFLYSLMHENENDKSKAPGSACEWCSMVGVQGASNFKTRQQMSKGKLL
jgi:hypothetical protein